MTTDTLSTLNPKQREAVEYNGGPCLIVAGAGTGKTRTLTCKIAYLIEQGISPSRILAVTFTNKASKEMRERVDALVKGQAAYVWIHTFHSFAVRLLRQNAEAAKLDKNFVIYDENEQKKIINLILEEAGLKEAKKEANYFLTVISRAKDDMLGPKEFMERALSLGVSKQVQAAEIYVKYQRKLEAAGALDFGDLLMKAVRLLLNNEEIRSYYQQYFQYILVDEYQDTNRTQYILIKTLAAAHRNLCVVGDPDQSIYSWRGADIRNILDFEKDFKDAKIITLEQNYRSTQIILDASNKLIRKNKNRKEKTLYSSRAGGDPVSVNELTTESEEANWTACQIQNLVEDEGLNLDEAAVFYRTNAQSRSFEETFRRVGLPYRLIGAVRFYDRKEIKDALAYARLLINPSDTVSFLRVLNTPRRGLGEKAQDALTAYAAKNNLTLYSALKEKDFLASLTPAALRGAQAFINIIEGLSLTMPAEAPYEILNRLLDLSGYKQSIENEIEKDPEAASRIGNLNELINAVKEYEDRCLKEEKEPSLAGYLQEVSLISGDENSETYEQDSELKNGAVTLMTVHLAKGLEFPTVFVSGLEEGLFPLSGKGDDDLEEERRLCYVAMTRAKKQLYMSYCSTRRIFGKTYSNLASRFLFDSGLIESAALQNYPQNAPADREEIAYKGRYNRWNIGRQNSSYSNENKYKESFKTFGKKFEQKDYFEDSSYLPPKRSSAPFPTAPQNAYPDAKNEAEAPEQSIAACGREVRVGSRVKHGAFGEGKVTLITGAGEAVKITVVFANGTKRVFMLRYAPLTLL